MSQHDTPYEGALTAKQLREYLEIAPDDARIAFFGKGMHAYVSNAEITEEAGRGGADIVKLTPLVE